LSHGVIEFNQVEKSKIEQLNQEDSRAEIEKLKKEFHDLRKEDIELINEERNLRIKAEESLKQEREKYENQLNLKSQIADEVLNIYLSIKLFNIYRFIFRQLKNCKKLFFLQNLPKTKEE
jgi:phosphate uptake regulator